MGNKIIFDEALARGIFKIAETSIEIDGNSEDNFITSLKCSGYIRKSAVEEAEEMWDKMGDREISVLEYKQREAIQYLKAENERLKK